MVVSFLAIGAPQEDEHGADHTGLTAAELQAIIDGALRRPDNRRRGG
jgi:hypothetical protein